MIKADNNGWSDDEEIIRHVQKEAFKKEIDKLKRITTDYETKGEDDSRSRIHKPNGASPPYRLDPFLGAHSYEFSATSTKFQMSNVRNFKRKFSKNFDENKARISSKFALITFP